jgi:Tfp pilus assembly PilM family ATPase
MALTKKNSVGVQLSDQSVRFAEFVKKGGKISLGNYGEEMIPEGVIEAGVIQDYKKLAEVLKRFKQKHKISRAYFSVPEEQFQPFRLTIPKVNTRGAHETIELIIRDYVSLEGKDFKFDHKVIRQDGNSYEIEISAIHTLPKAGFPEAISESGFLAADFESEAEALRRALVHRHDEENYMIVYFGGSKTTIAVAGGTRVRYKASFALAGKVLGRMIESGNLALIRDEIDKHYVAWQSFIGKHRHAAIKKIILCGEPEKLGEAAEYLEKNLRLQIELGNAWVNVLSLEEEVPEMTHGESLRYAAALGLALKGFK